MSTKPEKLFMLSKCQECDRECKTYSAFEHVSLSYCPDFTGEQKTTKRKAAK